MRGRYIALEGIEGAGKSTLAPLVADLLARPEREVIVVREPGGTGPGEAIRQILLHDADQVEPWTEALLFAAARAQLAREVVGPALAAGTWVVSDRSVYSSLAYQGGGRGLGVDRVRQVNVSGLGEVWPDLVVLLHVDPVTGLERQDVPDRIGSQGVDFQSRVAGVYDKLAADEPERFVVVQASGPVELVAEEIATAVEERG